MDSILRQTSNIYGGGVDAFSPDKPGTYLLLPKYYYDIYGYSFDPYKWKNYTVSARMRSTDDDAIGIMFGYRDANNYYRFSMDRERKYRRLVKVVNGIFSVLAARLRGLRKGPLVQRPSHHVPRRPSRSWLTVRKSSTCATPVTIKAASPCIAGITAVRNSTI